MSSSRLLWTTVLLVATACLFWLAQRGEAVQLNLAPVQRGAFEVSAQEEGRTRLKQRFVVSAPIGGHLRRITWEPGDRVDAEQVIAEIESLTSGLLDSASRSRIEAERAAAEQGVRAAEQRVAAARSAAQFAERERQRLAAMGGESVISPSQLDAASMRARQTAAELLAARAEAQAALARERAVRATLQGEGRAAGAIVVPVTAPVAGRIVRRFQESAIAIAAGQPLLEIGQLDALQIEVEALSTLAVQLAADMPARVLRWGGTSALNARVARIEPGGFTKVSALGVEEQRVRVILDLTDPTESWAALGDGYRVEIEFVLWQGENVLQIPASALYQSGREWAVFVVEAGRARSVTVEPGRFGESQVEIRAGLDVGQSVVAFPDDRVHDGVRVEAVVEPGAGAQ